MRLVTVCCLTALLMSAAVAADDERRRITNLYDAFGEHSTHLTKDWGYAALIEYRGRRILFDTGNDAAIFASNVRALQVDLTRLDAVVISHRHGDHTSGLAHLLAQNPAVPIWVPREAAFFKGHVPAEFIEHQPDLPKNLQYFDGQTPHRLESGSPWPQADFRAVQDHQEILPGIFVISTQSRKPGTMEMNELSLALRTPEGLAVIVGCSHPGVERILAAAAAIDSRLYLVTGGFHLVREAEAEVGRVATALHDALQVRRVAPAHCSSELGFKVLRRRFGSRFEPAGLGSVIELP